MRILVSGGAGYVGSVSVERLLAAGHSVSVLDDCSTGHAAAVPAEAHFSRASYADEEAVAGLLTERRIEAILHCGARSLVAESIREPALYYRANVVGGIALLEAARRSGVTRFVFSSTAAVYGIPATV
ncbi:MAG: NAD-dependent epimerase/dehydratase family protein, partial [Candidatus Limnocylindrales bacterium]